MTVEFKSNDYGLAEACLVDLIPLSMPHSLTFLQCLIAMSHTAESIECLWPILDSLMNTIDSTHELFESYCELLFGIASRSQSDTYHILLCLHQHTSSPCSFSDLLDTLSVSPSLSLVHLFGSLLSGLGESTSDSLCAVPEVTDILFHILHSHPCLRTAVIQSLTPLVRDESTADFMLSKLIDQGLLGEIEPSVMWCMENDILTAKAWLFLLSQIACYASQYSILADNACMILKSSYLTDAWRVPILTFIFSILKSWQDSNIPEFLSILDTDHSFHHYLIHCIPIGSTSALCSLRILLLLLHRPQTQFSQQDVSLLATFALREMDLVKPGSSYILHRLSAVILLLLCDKKLIDWSQQDSELLGQFRTQLSVYVELAYDGKEKWLILLHTLIRLLYSSSGRILLCGSDHLDCIFIRSLIKHTLLAIQTHYIRFLTVSLSAFAVLSSAFPHIFSSFTSVSANITQLIRDWSQNPIDTPLLSLLQFLIHCHEKTLIQEATLNQNLSVCFSNARLLQAFLVASPSVVSNSFILSHLSSFDPQTRSLCYLLLFKETSLSTWSIPQLMRDATDTDLILSISAMDILLRIIEVPEKVNSTVSAMMEMEREMSV